MSRPGGHGRFALLALLTVLALLAAAGPAAAATGFALDEPLSSTDSSPPALAVAPNGYAVAAWTEFSGSSVTAVRVAVRPPGGAWSAPQALPAGLVQSITLSAAVDAAGDAAVAWTESVPGGQQVVVATRPAGGGFGQPEALSDRPSTFGSAVGIDANGRVTLLYGPFPAVAVRDFQAGGSALAAAPVTLSATGCGGFFVHLAVAPSGDAVAGYGCGGAVFALRRAGSWTVSPTVSDSSGDCVSSSASFNEATSVAIDTAGDAVGVLRTVSIGIGGGIGGCVGSPSVVSATLVLPLAGVMRQVGPPFVSGPGFGTIQSSVVAPRAARSPNGLVAVWGDAGNTGRSLVKARFFAPDGSGGSAAQTVSTAPSQVDVAPGLGVAADGRALVTWFEGTASGGSVLAAERPAGGAFGAPLPVSSGGEPASPPVAALDDAGDGAVAWAQGTGAALRVHARGYDATPPQLTSTTIPTTATVGVPTAFAVTPFDVWSPTTTSWSFGDGTSASGAAVQHTYARAGTFTATVLTVDALGNPVTRSGAVQVTARGGAGGGGGGGGGGTAAAAPRLTSASLTHTTFRVGRRATPIHARLAGRASAGTLTRATLARRRGRGVPVGTTFRFTLDRAANVRIGFARRTRGVRGPGGQCVRPSRRLAGGRRCALFVPDGTLVRSAPQGAVSVPFSGRVGRRALRPGRYRAGLTAAVGGRSAKPTVLSFRIVR